MAGSKILGRVKAGRIKAARIKAVGFVATSVLAFSLIPAAGALADTPPVDPPPTSTAPSTCVVDGYTPTKIVVGASAIGKKFAAQVHGCDVGEWLVAAGPIAAFSEQPVAYISPEMFSNANAGTIPTIVWAAGKDEDPDNEDAGTVLATSFTLLRRATFGGSFNAGPEPAKAGAKIALKGLLGRVSWNYTTKVHYLGYGARHIQVQFRAAGTTNWTTIKSVTTGKKGGVKTTVPAVSSGAWRLHFAGNGVTSSADSTADFVVVK